MFRASREHSIVPTIEQERVKAIKVISDLKIAIEENRYRTVLKGKTTRYHRTVGGIRGKSPEQDYTHT